MQTTIMINKAIGGLMALLLLLNININGLTSDKISVKINRYHIDNFYGTINVDGKKLPLIVSVSESKSYKKEEMNKKEDSNKKENINKKEDKTIEKINNDKTPGKIVIKIPNKNGEIVYENDMGNGKKSEFDQRVNEKVIDSLVGYIEKHNDDGISSKTKDIVKGFYDYCKKPKKSFLSRFISWL